MFTQYDLRKIPNFVIVISAKKCYTIKWEKPIFKISILKLFELLLFIFQ